MARTRPLLNSPSERVLAAVVEGSDASAEYTRTMGEGRRNLGMKGSVIVGYDIGGAPLSQAIQTAVLASGLLTCVVDGSGRDDYPDVAFRACDMLLQHAFNSAILVCGTGLGMSIAANKVDGIRAARCTDGYSVERARTNSNANVLTLGAEITTPEQAERLVRCWLQSEFSSERSQPKLAKIAAFEARVRS